MKIELDKRQSEIVDGASEFARSVLAPRARENDERGAFPDDLVG
jgi:hypothetical protein